MLVEAEVVGVGAIEIAVGWVEGGGDGSGPEEVDTSWM